MARVPVGCWQQTYRALVPDAAPGDPGVLAVRERLWTAALTGERYRGHRVAVAGRGGELIGIAMSGPPLDAGAVWPRQLSVLYVAAAGHGTGAGRALLAAVADPQEPVGVWVAGPNPRAQAFYRTHGPVADGAAQAGGRDAGDPPGPRPAAPAVAQFARRFPPGAAAWTSHSGCKQRGRGKGCEWPRVGRGHATEHACATSAHARIERVPG
jgi:hypothetical protein